MHRGFISARWAQAVPRVIVDFLLVHLSMIGALVVSVVYRTAVGFEGEARDLVQSFSQYYSGFFWLLSPIFPLVFFLNGFYTRSRSYEGRHKTWIILRGVGIGVLIFFTANYFLFGATRVGRSVALPFLCFAVVSLSGARFLKAFLEERYEVKPKASAARVHGRGRVLIVGGAGYIGSLLSEQLLERGHEVRVLDSLVYGDEPLSPVKSHPAFDLQIGDCRNIHDVVKAFEGVDAVVHLAGIVGDPACDLDHQAALEVNYAATRMLTEVAKGHGASRMLFASSCSVYGASNLLMDEASEVKPISLYGQTKVDSESVLLNASSETFHPTILRFATVFGLGYRPRFDLVVNLLAAKARQDRLITIYNGEQWRPFIHVKDLVSATVQVLEAPARLVSGEVFNIGDTQLNHTLSEVAEIIREVFPDTRIEHVENADRRNYRVSFDKLHKRLGFQARYTLRDGVLELKKAFENGLIADYTDVRYHNQRFLKVTGSPAYKDELDEHVMAAFATRSGR